VTPKTIAWRTRVEFGDCDPAGIVWYPNFFGWFDAASRHFFVACGLPPWRETALTHGIIGTPVLDVSARFVAPASYGDEIEVRTSIVEWRDKTFVQRHELLRDGQLLCEGRDVRAFVTRHPDDPVRMKAVPAPPEFRALCE
jgi:4-hydroxybenzoyl-CoA thioesterase